MKSKRHPNPTPTLLACALAGCLAFAPTAFAQSTSATLRGQVSAAGAPAPARITATNVATGLTRSVQAGSDGSYTLAGLPPGTYRVEVSADGRTWTPISAKGHSVANITTITFAPVASAFVRITLSGDASDAPAWAMQRLRLYRAGTRPGDR